MNFLHWSFIVLLYTKITGQFEGNWLVVFVPMLLYALYLLWCYAQYKKLMESMNAGNKELLAQLTSRPMSSPHGRARGSLRIVDHELPGEKKPDDDDDTPKVH